MSYKQNEGTFQINSATIITNDEPFLKEAQYLSASLTEFISSTISIGKASENIIQLKLDSSIPNEGYRLEVNTNGIIISASVPAGIFYGIQSLKCLLPLVSWKLKQATLNVSCAIVNDKPRFEYRGLHIDVARNFQTKEEFFFLKFLLNNK